MLASLMVVQWVVAMGFSTVVRLDFGLAALTAGKMAVLMAGHLVASTRRKSVKLMAYLLDVPTERQ
jgi:hypothetical protein